MVVTEGDRAPYENAANPFSPEAVVEDEHAKMSAEFSCFRFAAIDEDGARDVFTRNGEPSAIGFRVEARHEGGEFGGDHRFEE